MGLDSLTVLFRSRLGSELGDPSLKLLLLILNYLNSLLGDPNYPLGCLTRLRPPTTHPSPSTIILSSIHERTGSELRGQQARVDDDDEK